MTDSLPTITLSHDVVRQLSFDVANEFFTEEELCVRYDLTLGQLKYVQNQPSFKKHVLDTRQLLADDGKELRLQAKEYVMDVLKMYKDIVDDPDNSTNARMKAGDAIMEIARVKQLPNTQLPGGGGGFSLHLHTNLDLEGETLEGAYTAVSAPTRKRKRAKAPPAQLVDMEPIDPAAEFL